MRAARRAGEIVQACAKEICRGEMELERVSKINIKLPFRAFDEKMRVKIRKQEKIKENR